MRITKPSFSQHLLSPLSLKKNRISSLITSIALGIFTLGTIHLIYSCLKNRTKKSPLTLGINTFFNSHLSRGELWHRLEKFQKTILSDHKKLRSQKPWDRWKNILPYEDNSLSEKISGSFIQLPYFPPFIATQAPLPDFSEDFVDFIKKHKIKDVIVLAPPEEIHPYWQEMKDKNKFHLHVISNWPDEKTISPSHLAEYVRNIDDHLKNSSTPILIHCSAGVGRTGTFLAAYYAYKNRNNKKALDIPQSIAFMRLNRPFMVRTFEQFELIYETKKLFKST